MKMRVAALQFGAGTDVPTNLATCLRMIDEAARHQPDLMVLPEFSNHASWYDNKQHCFDVSVPLGGPFLQAIGDRARQHRCYIVVNVTLQRVSPEHGPYATGSSVLFDRDGAVLSVSDKQVLMGHENDFLERATAATAITAIDCGRVSLYACMDGVINETPRGLALGGAQVLCNSLNSFALDEANLHIPVRAAENKVFVVAAEKVAPLIPEFLLEPVSKATSIPAHFLHGAGESQIVAPDGRVLAKGPRMGEAIVVADIDPAQADDKRRPDGTDIFAARRPELYGPLARPPATLGLAPGASELKAAVLQTRAEGDSAIAEAADLVAQAARAGAKLIALPELFHIAAGQAGGPRVNDVAAAEQAGARAVTALQAALRGVDSDGVVVVTSVVRGGAHVGVMVSRDGVLLEQTQLHRVARHAWGAPGDTSRVIQLPWARVGIVVGDDAIYPEAFRLLALQGAEVVVAPLHLQEAWELALGLPERAAENRICLLVASRPTPVGASAVMTLHKDFTIMTPWETRPFDGNISTPIVTLASGGPGATTAAIHPANAQNRFVSHRTDVVDGRPWHLAGAIVRTMP
ncbi:MAG TPA: carbon-nitrogen hydrolase family protein [Thermoflexales bacterium]|nr:carbon-nitrogen hydrolase family protein [Thermoflexales bacterium]HQY25458.1 carbon-nitrogen hydrolase family protein [Thermoflexales bacterium]HQZ54608.1 carbon-nitrogen hydrolase family protein [Thermoflexales bacterium]HRA52602.1 carbon-nitrogen hydrolase family protein [Thermoflexales bacterium]